MVSSARQAIACILLILGIVTYSQSQTVPAKTPSASISGKVTLKGKGLPGILVAIDPEGGSRGRYRGTTDQLGNYRITNLPAGTYEIRPVLQSFVLETGQPKESLVIAEGETIEDVNFSLVRGGVVTGRVTDADDQPLIEESITISPVDELKGAIAWARTDDRGVYRAFGLQQGKYKVFVGQDEEQSFPGGSRNSKHTFHPSATDSAKATIIEVTEGSEIIDVDIVMGRPDATFKVAGRIIDGETGKPLPNVRYGVSKRVVKGNRTSGRSSDVGDSNADGEFKLENVSPGKYSLYFSPPKDSSIRPEIISFEMVDRDITDLQIKTSKGASVSGVVVLEGAEEKTGTLKPAQMEVLAFVENNRESNGRTNNASVNPDGGFKISGLPSGMVQFSIFSMGPKHVGVVRVERNGVVQPQGINLKDGEQVAGLRLVIRYLSGTIRGVVKLENGDLPSSRVSVWFNLLDDNPLAAGSRTSVQIDSRGRFFFNSLPAGTYEFVAVAEPLNSPAIISKQEVTVADNSISEVTLTLDLKRKPEKANP